MTTSQSTVNRSRRAAATVLYEDRPELTGLKLAALSLRSTAPGLPIVVMAPSAPPGFQSWAEKHAIEIAPVPEAMASHGWNVKPTVLLHMLAHYADVVTWFDTDIIATSSLETLLSTYPVETLVATEEYAWGHSQGSEKRTTALGLPVGRHIARSVNTGVLRVSESHRSLLLEWERILGTDEYVRAQILPANRRPLTFLGDQEVLCGLLGAQQFASVPLAQLTRGVDIAQCFGPSGFTVRERWTTRGVLPPLVHAMGRKPWSRPTYSGSTLNRFGSWWQNMHLDLTPYTAAAQPYLDELGEPARWARPVTMTGRILSRNPSSIMREMPLTVLDTSQRAFRRAASIRQISA
ncbi:hypothetical protein [Calidifontibacter indicus]|uniref:hypothetical protein n=1 Tax=Calidifontibacter indicus TaxID=419650 RepID=UPI003D719391